jgi:hypothetical protein
MRVVLLLVLGACSFAMVLAPAKTADPSAACTESSVSPIFDAVLATGLIAGGAVGMSNGATLGSSCSIACAPPIGPLLITPGVVYAFSSIYGFATTAKCRRLHAASSS